VYYCENRRAFILEKYRRRSIRLKGYDYSKPGYYFVTLCTKDRECILGEIASSKMILNEMGKMVDCIWRELPIYFLFISIGQYIIMPNHFHGIIKIDDQNKDLHNCRGLINQTPTGNQTQKINLPPTSDQIPDDWMMMKNPKITLGKIVRYFKAKSAVEIRNKMGNSFCWQRNYHEHIINDENELTHIRKYIQDNPVNWINDEDNPINVNMIKFQRYKNEKKPTDEDNPVNRME
jgi:putative transposase